MTQEFTNTKYQNLSYREHVRLRLGMYLGSKESTENEIWILNKDENKLKKEQLNYSIALYNSIDEILVNSIDHCHRTVNIKGAGKCDTIKLNFNKDTGEITVFNNGEGIPVKLVENEEYYIPEMIFCKEMSGSNFETNDTKISAGMNGSGSKITNILSEYFIIDTNDLESKLNYIQKIEGGNLTKNKPIIKKLTKSSKPYTQIQFLLEYILFNENGFTETLSNILDKLLFTRMNYISVYLGSKYKIYYNDEEIVNKKLDDLSNLITDPEDIIKCQLYNKNDKKVNPIDINICLWDSENSQEHISFINGLYVSQGGTHIRYINKLILENLKSKLEKKLKDKVKITNKMISNYLFILFSGNITNPDYKNQSKTELSISETRFKEYTFDSKIYKQIWDKIETKIDEIYLDKISKENVSKKTSKLRGIKKYRSADKAGTSESYKCSLFIPEGDSAESCIKNGLTTNKDLGYKYYGIFNIQGVPLNVRKEIDIKEVKKNDKITYIIDRKKKLIDNERFTSLVKVLNLNYSYNYEMNAKGDEEFKTLRYAKVLIAVDFDSVSGDTPLLLLDSNNNILIKNIEDLTEIFNTDSETNKEYGLSNYKIWTEKGWTDIKHVMRHKVSKKMYRVLTHTGCVDVTEDHSLLNEFGNKISPNECQIGGKLLHSFPLFKDNEIEIPEDLELLGFEEVYKIAKKIGIQNFKKLGKTKLIPLIRKYKLNNFMTLNKKNDITVAEAYVMGLFLGDGHCRSSIRKREGRSDCDRFTWSISNCNLKFLNNSKEILEKIYGNNFIIREIKDSNSSYGINQRYQLELLGGVKTSYIIDKYRNLFYYKDSKYIHPDLLNNTKEVREELFRGFYDADGLHNLEKSMRTDVFTKITTQCIFTLGKSIGYMVSINNNLNNKKEIYNLNLTKYSQSKISNKIKKIWEIDTQDEEFYVYDLETENHHFQAGIGEMIVHNTDGLGMINGLILNFFNVFFPNLMKRKMLQIFYTPLIRAYPTKKGKFIEEFYNNDDYEKWCTKNNVNDYKINYIKGLATHSNMEIKQMFKNVERNIYTYELDRKSNEYFEIYFGEDSDKRKKILASEEEYKEDDFKEKYDNKTLTCSYQLNVNTKEFQLDNIQRKMPHIIDGLNPARRKILAGSLNKFRHSNTKLKVFQLGGYVAEKMFYHHGSDSLNKTIINMAQDFPGSRNIPLLLPIGQFGSRFSGGRDAGSPRYIDTKLNKAITDLLFPHVDDNLLEYHIIDGEIGEPKYFIPVIPLVLLEDVCLPSTGWKIELYARDINQVIDNVKSMIKNDNCKVKSMKYFKNKFKGREILNKNYNMLIGNYEIPAKTKDQVIITELPPRVWNENFIESLEKKDFIDDVIDESSIYDVKIKVLFKKGELIRLQTEYESKNEHLDYLEYNLKLYSKLSHCINLYTQKNTVMEFKNYTDIMKHWYIVRKECYFKRIERENIILKYKIIMTESIIRFIENHESYGISKKSDSVAIGILESNDYQMLNKTAIDSPGLIKNEDLENHIININQSYDYLLNLSYRKMNSESYERYKTNLEELKKKLEYYNKPDIYKTIWVEEINKLCKELENGLKKGFYQEDPNLFKK
jgi:DNA gyrase/topoisomerase IV subunit B